MSDQELETMHTLSGDILECKRKIKSFEYRLGELDIKTCFSAKVQIQVGDRRSTTMEWLSKDEVRGIFNRRLQEETTKLKALESEYKAHYKK